MVYIITQCVLSLTWVFRLSSETSSLSSGLCALLVVIPFSFYSLFPKLAAIASGFSTRPAKHTRSIHPSISMSADIQNKQKVNPFFFFFSFTVLKGCEMESSGRQTLREQVKKPDLIQLILEVVFIHRRV